MFARGPGKVELNPGLSSKFRSRAVNEQLLHGCLRRSEDHSFLRSRTIPIVATSSNFGNDHCIVHVRHQLDEFVVEHSTCGGEHSAIAPSVTDRTLVTRSGGFHPGPKLHGVVYRPGLDCLIDESLQCQDIYISKLGTAEPPAMIESSGVRPEPALSREE